MHYWLTTQYAVHLFALEYGRKELLGLRKYEVEYFRTVYAIWKKAISSGDLSLDEQDVAGKSLSLQSLEWLKDGLSLLVYDLLMVNQAIWDLRLARRLIVSVGESRTLGIDPVKVLDIIPELILEATELLDIALSERLRLRNAHQEWRRKRSSKALTFVELILKATDDEIRKEFLASCRQGFGPMGQQQQKR